MTKIELLLNCPFGECLVALSTNGKVEMLDNLDKDSLSLPEGMRVDGFNYQAAEVLLQKQDYLEAEVQFKPKLNAQALSSTGQFLAAYEVEYQKNCEGAYAIRDENWFEQTYNLKLDSIETSDTGSFSRFKANKNTTFNFEVAAAWTANAQTDQEKNSPWFAVDKLLRI